MSSLKHLSILFLFFILTSPTDAFNITKMLDQESDFSTFNSLLSQTKLAEDINRRQTITVLAVANDNISPLSGQPQDVIKRILSIHVVLDYYDMKKLQNLNNKSTLLTTLFQSSGGAKGNQGFLNVTIMKNGDVAFGSAAQGATLDSNLVKSVTSQPYNVSVLEVTSVIMVDVKAGGPTKSPPAPSPEAPSESPDSSSPPSPTPEKSSAESPEGESPDASSPSAEGPGGEGSDADSPSDKSSGVKTVSQINAFVALMVMLSFAWWFLALW